MLIPQSKNSFHAFIIKFRFVPSDLHCLPVTYIQHFTPFQMVLGSQRPHPSINLPLLGHIHSFSTFAHNSAPLFLLVDSYPSRNSSGSIPFCQKLPQLLTLQRSLHHLKCHCICCLCHSFIHQWVTFPFYTLTRLLMFALCPQVRVAPE